MEGTLSRVYSLFSISHSNFYLCEKFESQFTKPPLMADVFSLRAISSAERDQVSTSRPLKFAKRSRQGNSGISPRRKGPVNPAKNPHKLNLEVSPHRAVSAVRLMRIELGGAFADLLNEKEKGSGDNEMGYVERTLGFRTWDLEDRDLRLVTDIVGGAIRWRRYLDHLIVSLCHDENTFRRMEPLLLQFESTELIGDVNIIKRYGSLSVMTQGLSWNTHIAF